MFSKIRDSIALLSSKLGTVAQSFTSRHRMQELWASSYEHSSASSTQYRTAVPKWHLLYYLYLLTHVARCVVFVAIAHSGTSIVLYEQYDPVMVVLLGVFTRQFTFDLCMAPLFLFALETDYLVNIKLLPMCIAAPLHQLMVLNYDRFWQLNSQLSTGATSSSVLKDLRILRRGRNSLQVVLQHARTQWHLWQTEAQFHARQLSCYPRLSAKTRTRAALFMLGAERAELLSYVGLCKRLHVAKCAVEFFILIYFLALLIVLILLLNMHPIVEYSRLYLTTFSQLAVVIVDFALLFFVYLYTLRFAFFWMIATLVWCLVANWHTRECTRHLLHCVQRCGRSKLGQIVTHCATLYRREHTRLLTQLATLNRALVSPLLFVAITSNIPSCVYLLSILNFLPLAPWPRAILLLILIGQIVSIFFLISPLLYTMDVLYDDTVVGTLVSLQMRLHGPGVIRQHKMKLLAHYEFVHSHDKAHFCFTYGPTGEITKKWFLEVCESRELSCLNCSV